MFDGFIEKSSVINFIYPDQEFFPQNTVSVHKYICCQGVQGPKERWVTVTVAAIINLPINHSLTVYQEFWTGRFKASVKIASE